MKKTALHYAELTQRWKEDIQRGKLSYRKKLNVKVIMEIKNDWLSQTL
jgi:hypothetical protein